MAPSRRSGVKVGKLRIDAAYSVLNPMGFTKADIRKAIKSLLKVYGADGWLFIEEYRYKVVIETILGAQDTSERKDEGECEEISSVDEPLSYTPPRESALVNEDEMVSLQNNYNNNNGKDKGKAVAASSFHESPTSSPSVNANNANGKAVAAISFHESPTSSPSVNANNANGKAVLDAGPSNPNWLPREATRTPYYMSPPAVGPSGFHIVSEKIDLNSLWVRNANGNNQDAGLSNVDWLPPAGTRTPFYDTPPAAGPSTAPVSNPPPNCGLVSNNDEEEAPQVAADLDQESVGSCSSPRSPPNPATDLDDQSEA